MFLRGFSDRLGRFLYGRNGPDTLYRVCIWSAFAIALINIFLQFWPLSLLYFLLFGYAIFRFFSRNLTRRQAENQAFRRFWSKVRQGFSLNKKKLTDRSHVYRKCPQCKSQLRLPRTKGTHTVRCPRCSHSFSLKI